MSYIGILCIYTRKEIFVINPPANCTRTPVSKAVLVQLCYLWKLRFALLCFFFFFFSYLLGILRDPKDHRAKSDKKKPIMF